MATNQVYNVEMLVDSGAVVVRVYGEIWSGGWYLEYFRMALEQALVDSGRKRIDVRINSEGGDVFNAYAMMSILKQTGLEVNCYVDGLSASAATILMLAGKRIEMSSLSLMMIHNPSSYVGGEAKDMVEAAKFLEKVKTQIVDAYHHRTGINKEKLGQMMDDSTWLSPNEALEMKFVDGIYEVLADKLAEEGEAKAKPDMREFIKKAKNHEGGVPAVYNRFLKELKESNQNQLNYQSNQGVNLMEGQMANPTNPPTPGAAPVVSIATPVGLDAWIVENKEALTFFERIKNMPEERTQVEALQAAFGRERELKVQNAALAQEVQRLQSAELDNVVEMAVADGRITALEAANYKQVGDISLVKALLSNKKATVRPSQLINRVFAPDGEDKGTWDFAKWQEKDPEGLAEMEDRDPTKFGGLYNAYVQSLQAKSKVKLGQ